MDKIEDRRTSQSAAETDSARKGRKIPACLTVCSSMLAGALLIGGNAYASQPSDPVISNSAGDTAMGTDALVFLTTGGEDTAAGAYALANNSTGSDNTATGYETLNANTTGYDNTAVGSYALGGNRTGFENTASGNFALYNNTTGAENTATGFAALAGNGNATGNDNTATGTYALYNTTTGSYNTAAGASALTRNTTGTHNTAAGYGSLSANSTGTEDTALGYEALYSNTTASENTALGNEALYNNRTGANNLAAGFHAGINVTSGSNNIDIGNAGEAAESGVIRIGTAGTHNQTFLAGVEGAKITGAAVYVTASGQLGVLASSERYKTAIAPLGSNGAKLGRLRPVTFHLKADPRGALQYGLIAEEVDKVYPELVIHNAEGRIEGVRYDELAPLLLREVQAQRQELQAQRERLAAQGRQQTRQDAQLHDLQQQLAALNAMDRSTQMAVAKQARDELIAAR